jgi:PAS domain S-box-containing protein
MRIKSLILLAPRSRRLAIAIGYVVLHVGLVSAALLDPVTYPSGPPWNPVTGLVLALLLLGGVSYAPLVVGAATLAGLVARNVDPGLALFEGLAMATIYGGAAVFLVERQHLDLRLERLQDSVRLLAVGTIAAAFHAATIVPFRHVGEISLVTPYLRLWAGDILGIVVITPFLMLHIGAERLPRPTLLNLVEAASIAFVLWIDFGLHASEKFRFFYLLIMPLVWIAVRHGLRGASAAIFLAQLGLLVAVEVVPFPDHSLTVMQLIMLTMSVTTLLLGSAMSERRISRAALKDSEARLNAIVSMAPDGVLTLDDAGTIESVNPAAEGLLGFVAGELVGHHVTDVLPGIDLATLPFRGESNAMRHDGALLPVEIAIGAAHLSDRRLAIAVIRDISQRKASEARLWEHHAVLANAARLSVSEKLATALAHQLNQPLAAVIGYTRAAQRLLKSGKEPMQSIVDAMDKAVDQTSRCGEIIRRTREFLSSGELQPAPIFVLDLVQEAMQLVTPQYTSNGVTLQLAIPTDLPLVEVDPLQVEQVLVNLLNNALDAIVMAASPRREVVLSAAAIGRNWVEVTVRDSGPGIAREIADRLFTAFTTSKSNGMGMGLFIAKSIIEAHGGTIRVDSRPQEGAAFSFTLPTVTDHDD